MCLWSAQPPWLPLGTSLFPRGQMIFLMQYSERMPYGPTSLRLIISVVMMSVSVVSLPHVRTAWLSSGRAQWWQWNYGMYATVISSGPHLSESYQRWMMVLQPCRPTSGRPTAASTWGWPLLEIAQSGDGTWRQHQQRQQAPHPS